MSNFGADLRDCRALAALLEVRRRASQRHADGRTNGALRLTRNGQRPVCLFVAPQCVQPLFKATPAKDTMQAQPDGGSDQSIEQRCCPSPRGPAPGRRS